MFSGFALVQLLVQALNAVCGFLLVRALDKPDYAWFTIASGISAALISMTDAGISSAVTAIGGEVWQDRGKFSNLVHTALRERLRMGGYAVVLVSPLSLWLLLRNGCPLLEAAALTLIATSSLWLVSTAAILCVVNRLHSRSADLQKADIALALTRVILTAGLILAGWATPWTALLALLLSQGFQWWLMRRQTRALLGHPDPEPDLFRTRIHAIVRQMYPNMLFVCVQGQLTTWLISVFASTSAVADFGALWRLGALFAVLGGPLQHMVAPAFARCPAGRKLRWMGLGTLAGSVAFCGGICLAGFFQGQWFLAILGAKYQHLDHELVVGLAAMSMGSLAGMLWLLNSAKGWLQTMWMNIPVTMLTQVFFLMFIPVDTVERVVWFSFSAACAQAFHALCVFGKGLLHRRVMPDPIK